MKVKAAKSNINNGANNHSRVPVATPAPHTVLRVNGALASLLEDVRKRLPHGAVKEIAKMCDCSGEYIRLFFKGLVTINEDNIKILDAAERMVDRMMEESIREKQMEERAANKAEAVLKKASE